MHCIVSDKEGQTGLMLSQSCLLPQHKKKNDNMPDSDISFCFFSEAQCLVHI